MALEYCSSLASEKRDDANSVMVDGEERVLKNVEEVESVKVPVKLLLVCVLHMVQGDTESRLKGLYRLFKEWWWSGGMIVSKESKTMNREEFEEVVKYCLASYHLPVDYLTRKDKGFPLNSYHLASASELVDKCV